MSGKRRKEMPQPPTDDDIIIDGISVADRVEHLARMNLNALMRNCGVLSSAQLNGWLDGATITHHPDNFGGFEILYGFDQHGQDFVIAKNKQPDGLHFAIIEN